LRVFIDTGGAWLLRGELDGGAEGAGRETDPDRIIEAQRGVVQGQRLPKPRHLGAHDAVMVRIECARPAENIRAHRIGLDACAGAVQFLLDQIAQQACLARGGAKRPPCDDLVDLFLNLLAKAVRHQFPQL
jgi:hypothetical protein